MLLRPLLLLRCCGHNGRAATKEMRDARRWGTRHAAAERMRPLLLRLYTRNGNRQRLRGIYVKSLMLLQMLMLQLRPQLVLVLHVLPLRCCRVVAHCGECGKTHVLRMRRPVATFLPILRLGAKLLLRYRRAGRRRSENIHAHASRQVRPRKVGDTRGNKASDCCRRVMLRLVLLC
jgi:hypothetical protein